MRFWSFSSPLERMNCSSATECDVIWPLTREEYSSNENLSYDCFWLFDLAGCFWGSGVTVLPHVVLAELSFLRILCFLCCSSMLNAVRVVLPRSRRAEHTRCINGLQMLLVLRRALLISPEFSFRVEPSRACGRLRMHHDSDSITARANCLHVV